MIVLFAYLAFWWLSPCSVVLLFWCDPSPCSSRIFQLYFFFTRCSKNSHFCFYWLLRHIIQGLLQVALLSLHSFPLGVYWRADSHYWFIPLPRDLLVLLMGALLAPYMIVMDGSTRLGSLGYASQSCSDASLGSLVSAPSRSHMLEWWFSA